MEKTPTRQGGERLSAYTVRPLEAKEGQSWDGFVRQSPQGTLFHTAKWHEATGQPYHIYGCFRQEILIGGMVLAANRNGAEASHYHRGPYLGLVLPPASGKYLTNLAYHRNITIELANYAKGQLRRVACLMGPEVVDLLPFIWAGYRFISLIPSVLDCATLTRHGITWKTRGETISGRRNEMESPLMIAPGLRRFWH